MFHAARASRCTAVCFCGLFLPTSANPLRLPLPVALFLLLSMSLPARCMASCLAPRVRVGLWQAAKWVAEVREATSAPPDDRPVLLQVVEDMGHGGHGGSAALQSYAMECAFLIKHCC